eukprot:COSAG05_NODE_333_length_11249_cov_629.633094_3_plen_88_part_00
MWSLRPEGEKLRSSFGVWRNSGYGRYVPGYYEDGEAQSEHTVLALDLTTPGSPLPRYGKWTPSTNEDVVLELSGWRRRPDCAPHRRH